MSSQFDVISGKDVSAQSTFAQEDFMQGINQLEPLDNIGFIVVGDTRPDITNNPRFIRYVWIDISDPDNPTFKRYVGDRDVLQDTDASWEALGVESLSVLTSMFASRSASGGVNVGLMKLNADFSATPSSAYYVLAIDATGKFVEAVNINTLVTNAGGLSLAALQTTGLVQGKFLGYNGGVAGYVSIIPSTDLIGVSRIAIETNIVPGTARYVVRTNAAGTALEFVTPNDLFSDTELAVARLLAAGAVENDILRRGPSIWEKVTPSLNLVGGHAINNGVTAPISGLGFLDTGATFSYNHNFTAVPKLVRVVIVNTGAAEAGYATGDEVDIFSLHLLAGNLVEVAVSCDASTVTVCHENNAGLGLHHKTTGVDTAITETQWQIKVYAWK